MKVAARMRGMTSTSIGEMPMVRIASISSVSFIVPVVRQRHCPNGPQP